MKGIGGNTSGIIQLRMTARDEEGNILKNGIGEAVREWKDAQTLTGWLDLASGDANYSAFNAKIQQSTHVFIADYVPLADGVKAENARMVIGGKRYDIMLIDNPMEMGEDSQLEIYLKYTGGQ